MLSYLLTLSFSLWYSYLTYFASKEWIRPLRNAWPLFQKLRNGTIAYETLSIHPPSFPTRSIREDLKNQEEVQPLLFTLWFALSDNLRRNQKGTYLLEFHKLSTISDVSKRSWNYNRSERNVLIYVLVI